MISHYPAASQKHITAHGIAGIQLPMAPLLNMSASMRPVKPDLNERFISHVEGAKKLQRRDFQWKVEWRDYCNRPVRKSGCTWRTEVRSMQVNGCTTLALRGQVQEHGVVAPWPLPIASALLSISITRHSERSGQIADLHRKPKTNTLQSNTDKPK